MLGALRAGKWGLVSGLVFAVAAAGSVFFLARPRELTKPLKIVGKPVDLARTGQVLTDLAAPLRCLLNAPDGNHLRGVLGSPPQALEISTEDVRTRPWNVLPVTCCVIITADRPAKRW
jgi:hypothetical protein